MTALVFPPILLPSRIVFIQDVPSKSGGLTLTGDEQATLPAGAGRWRAKATFSMNDQVGAVRGARLLAMRGLLAAVQGRSGVFLIGPFDTALAPGPLAGLTSTTAVAGAAAALGATSMRITMSGGLVPQAGQYFGLGGNRLYIIQQGGVAVFSGATYTVNFWPTLRAAVSSGAAVNFDTPVCQMRLASDGIGNPELTRGYRGESPLEMVEDQRP